MSILSLRTISGSLTAANRGRLLNMKERIQQKITGQGLDLSANSLWCSVEQDEIFGRNVPAYNIVALGQRALYAAEEMQAAVILHESLHLVVYEQMFFPVRREYPEIWLATTGAIEQNLLRGIELLPGKEIDRETIEHWGVNDSRWAGKLVIPEQIVAAVHERLGALSGFIKLIGATVAPPEKVLYQKFVAAEVINNAFIGSNLFLPTLILEEAYINNLVPWLLGIDFHMLLNAFSIDPSKVELSRKLHEAIRGRPEQLLPLLRLKGQALVNGFRQLLPAE